MNDQIVIRPTLPSKINSQLDFILLDGSGSMQSKWWPMLGAIDSYIATLKDQHIDSHIRLDVFCTNYNAGFANVLDLTMRDVPISAWRTFAQDPIGSHWGGTPLYDAIVVMGKNIRDLNPSQGCAVTIVTDGQESDSKFADIHQARSVLDWLRAQGFSVTFIGCDFDNSRQARALGANASNSIGVRKELLGQAGKLYGEKRARAARDGGDISFTDDEKTKFGGYLGHST